MNVLADYPRVREMMRALCELEEDDLEMPLELLMNIQRGRLRRPLEAMAELAPGSTAAGEFFEAALQAEQIVCGFWPGMQDGDIYTESERVLELDVSHRELMGKVPALRQQVAVTEGKPVLFELIQESRADWEAHETLVVLHEITWGTDIMLQLLPQLEVELGLHPDVLDMILMLGAR